jgi:hypothetical protein
MMRRSLFFYLKDRLRRKEALVMMDHLKPEEIVQMPLHMQILYYFEKWGVNAQAAELTKKAG